MNAKPHDRRIEIGQPAPVTVRFYGRNRCRPGAPLVLHFHGGAFTDGTLEEGAALAEALVAAGAVVASIDYPLAPGHKFPEAVEVGYGVLAWAARWRGRVCGDRAAPLYVAGEEAGGNIAAAVTMMARDRGAELAGQILVDPLLDPCIGTPSMRAALAGRAGECRFADGWHHYLRTPQDSDHPYAAPASARRLAGIPPTLIVATAGTPLRDEVTTFSQRLAAAGIPIQLAWAEQRGLRADRARKGAATLFARRSESHPIPERTHP
jgi:acetyl esterase